MVGVHAEAMWVCASDDSSKVVHRSIEVCYRLNHFNLLTYTYCL